MSALAVVDVDVERCPMGHEVVVYGFNGRLGTCPVCAKSRSRMAKRAHDNRQAGRHPRETLIWVPNAPLRERYYELLRFGVTEHKIALDAGYTLRSGGRTVGDARRLKRKLGIEPESSKERDPQTGKRIQYYVDRVGYNTAVVLCRALDLDPVEVGV